MKIMSCPNCQNKLSQKNIIGNSFPWKEFNDVLLLADFDALSCEECGEIILEGKDLVMLDKALEHSIRLKASNFLHNIKQKFNYSQKALARKVGISEVYLSEIISMKKTVSIQIFNLLKILANNPDTMKDLDTFLGSNEGQTKHAQQCYPEETLQVLSEKYKYLDEVDIRSLQNIKHFDNILSSDTERRIH
ncbi:TPA: helix-turn-helix transcriptional regulator [Legionella pneumophila]|uniref:helix-turn-helix domain-containing protein n=1 Tax=Legionella pneumophila TaxID=446 RepID=UPI00058C0E41|nr:helix-turn-helix transcriptional regulator [Legionella pneumophila]HAT9273923.1 helix-turn-helix domain-containing protein [Legionella pneumophila subsp. pneumophila]MCO1454139.1 helix-turn-helix transcriptional regulator [Legionella pneumophila]MCZ4722738.1 helix-turn-helix transcriptional regulator [Legionella pneumophila]MCZ4727427.1 helix-turn-helix transcriptional regulator [Legionella pneumophila]MCZ4734805.1 helix-turn-helix transcriptional regulator [Legionella pneumophila]